MNFHEEILANGYGCELKIQFNRLITPSEFYSIVHEIIENIAKELINNKAKIGHIKLYVKTSSGYLSADTIDLKYGININSSISNSENSFIFIINIIAIKIDKNNIAKITNETLDKISQKYNFSKILIKNNFTYEYNFYNE
jgi:hypothetical protein